METASIVDIFCRPERVRSIIKSDPHQGDRQDEFLVSMDVWSNLSDTFGPNCLQKKTSQKCITCMKTKKSMESSYGSTFGWGRTHNSPSKLHTSLGLGFLENHKEEKQPTESSDKGGARMSECLIVLKNACQIA